MSWAAAATVAALALLIAVKLLSGMLHRPTASTAQPAIPLPGSDADRSRSRRRGEPSHPPRTRATGPSTESPAPVTNSRAGTADLLPAARAAADGIQRDGRRLTRDALTARLRENGYPIGNARLTPLLFAVRGETSATP